MIKKKHTRLHIQAAMSSSIVAYAATKYLSTQTNISGIAIVVYEASFVIVLAASIGWLFQTMTKPKNDLEDFS